jgi:hypothetical protein
MARQGVTPGKLKTVGAEIGIEGIPEIKANIAKVLDRALGEKAKKVFMRAAMISVKEIRDLAPYDPLRKRGTHLRDAVFADYGDPKKPNVIVGVNPKKAPHGHWLEYGNVRMKAKPYFRPGVNAARAPMAAELATGMKNLITKE